MSNNALSSYTKTKYNTASRGDLLLAMYDGALRYAHVARAAILAKQPGKKGEAISALMAVIAELSNTLDHSKAQSLCDNLMRLYSYFLERVQQASLRMDVEPLDEVIGHLQSLRETWAQAVRIAEREGVIGAAAPTP
ncbi:MAG: flagellar export chaperone FliS [Deltaproteobacteria bacterium]|nr:MAG: flagellar export chaperone FliS [Deltaproteobacteria bacterium]